MAEPTAEKISPQQEVAPPVQEAVQQVAPAPEKADPQAAAVQAELDKMSNEDLLNLIESAYKSDAVANQATIQKATELLNARGAGKEAAAKLQEVRSTSWRNLLGDFIGGELYNLISEHVEVDDLQGYAHEALDGALGALIGQFDKLGLDGQGTAALEKFATALADSAVKAGDKWLASESGQSILGKISHWVDENPALVLLGVVIAAAGAIAADMPIPELKTKLNITKGLTADVSAQLGSLRNIALEAAKLDLQYVKGRFTAKAGVQKTDKGVGGSASVRYGDKDNFVQTGGSIDPDGKLVIDLNAAIQQGLLSGKIGGSTEVGTGNYNGTLNLRYGDQSNFLSLDSQLKQEGNTLTSNLGLSGQALFGNDQNNLKLNGGLGLQNGDLTQQLGASGRYQLNDNTHLFGDVKYDGNNVTGGLGTTTAFDAFKLTQQVGKDANGLFAQNQFGYQSNGLNLGLDTKDIGADGSIDTVSAELGYTVPQLAAIIVKYGRSLDGTQTGSVEVKHDGENFDASGKVSHDGTNTRAEGKASYTKGDWVAELAAGANLTTGELETLSAKLGFRDPKEFQAFSISLARSTQGQISTTTLSAMFEAQLGSFMVRGTADAAWKSTGEQNYNAPLLAARQLNPDWALIGGASASYNSLTGRTNVIPQIGAQYKNIPITVGYDFQNQGVVVGITIPFGR